MTTEEAIEMFVGGLVLDPATQAPIVILKEESGQFCLPIWIGMAEATAIATIVKDIKLARPMTHDLMYEALTQSGMVVQRIVITDLEESTYFAEIVITQGDNVIVLDSRPSDAIAIALRAASPIYVAKEVLDKAKVSIVQQLPEGEDRVGDETNERSGQKGESGSVEELVIEHTAAQRDFNSIDKDKWLDILSDLDPDDFKYKM